MNDDLQHYYAQLHARQRELRAQAARYGGDIPISLRNQIDDYDRAIELTEQALGGYLHRADWRNQLAILAVAPPPELPGIASTASPTRLSRLFNRPRPLSLQQQVRNRANMLSLVEYTWIEGVLNKSLHGAVKVGS